MYQAGHRPRGQRRKRFLILFLVLIIIAAAAALGLYIKDQLTPKTSVRQAKATSKTVTYEKTKTHFDEANFGLDLPSTWQKIPSPKGPYATYNWQTSNKGTNGELITIYEDTIPVNFAVNRVLVVEPQGETLATKGNASDNCSTFTKGVSPVQHQVGAPAKWQGVDFLCDQSNQARDVIGTSSKDGVNKVTLKSPTTGRSFTYLFSYTNHSINPDYTAFYDAINSFRMK